MKNLVDGQLGVSTKPFVINVMRKKSQLPSAQYKMRKTGIHTLLVVVQSNQSIQLLLRKLITSVTESFLAL